MAKKKFLLKVRCSRKKFLIFYIMIITIISMLIYFSLYKGIKLNTFTWITSAIFIYFAIKYPEYHRLKDWWGVTETSLVQSLGLFNKNVREVDFASISDLDLEQVLFKRFLNYGNVNVRLFLNETSISIKDINNPSKFIEDLQSIISKNRRSNHALRDI
ncbi:PH domain-containing protein [Candidatus Woesearchaeota archaeon]|nr:PH domain-containing protein [Candidatus Woesearchaeota archaeon]